MVVKEKAGLFSSLKFGLILVMFFMPFVTVSCSGVVSMPFSGINLSAGTNIQVPQGIGQPAQSKHVGAEPLATLAFLCAFLGFVGTGTRHKAARIFGIVAGFGGTVLLLLLKLKMDSGALKVGVGIHYEFGFYAALLLFFAAAAWNFYAFGFKTNKASPQLAQELTPPSTE